MSFEDILPPRSYAGGRVDDEAPERLSEQQFRKLKRLQAAGTFSSRAFSDANFVAPKEASRAASCRDYKEYARPAL